MNAVTIRNVQKLMEADEQLLQQATHIYFHDQTKDLDKTNIAELYHRLEQCLNLTSITLSSLTITFWAKLFSALQHLPKLTVIDISNSNISRLDIAKLANTKLEIIDNNSPKLFIPYLGKRIEYTEHQLQVMLLVGIAARLEYPNIPKFSRKRFKDLHVPISLSFDGLMPVLRIRHYRSDVEGYNYGKIENNSSVRIRSYIYFASNHSLSLQIYIGKIRPRTTKYDYHHKHESDQLQLTQTTHDITRPLKNNLLFAPIQSFDLMYYLYERKDRANDTWETKILRAYAILLALRLLHAKGKVHFDFKAENVILSYNRDDKNKTNAPYAELIDYESIYDCSPNSTIYLPHYRITADYTARDFINKNETAYHYQSRKEEDYALGCTLMLTLSAGKYNNETHIEGPLHDSWANIIKFHFERIKGTFGNEIAQIIDKLLKPKAERSSFAQALDSFVTLHPNLMEQATKTSYCHAAKKIGKLLQQCPNAESWLKAKFVLHKAAMWLSELEKLLQTHSYLPTSNLDSLIRIEVLYSIVWLHYKWHDNLPQEIAEAIDQIFSELLYTKTLDEEITTAWHRTIAKFTINSDIILSVLKDMFVRIRDDMLTNDRTCIEHSFVNDLGLLQNQIRYLIFERAPICTIFDFATARLREIYRQLPAKNNYCSPLYHALQQVATSRNARFSAEPFNSTVELSSNLLSLIKPTMITEDLDRMYSAEEIAILLPWIPNDNKDTARLRAFLPVFKSSSHDTRQLSSVQKLLQAGARSLSFAIKHGKVDHAILCLQDGTDPTIAEENEIDSPLELAFDKVRSNNGKIIFSQILDHIPLNKICILADFLNTALNSYALHDAAKLILAHIVKYPLIFAQLIRDRLTSAINFSYFIELTMLVECGIDPLTELDKTQIWNVIHQETCFPLALFSYNPYSQLTECKFNMLTHFMLRYNYNFVAQIVAIMKPTVESPKQLGFHLMVAARANQPNCVVALIKAGADLTCICPGGIYKGYTAEKFAKYYGFINAYNAAVSNRQESVASPTMPPIAGSNAPLLMYRVPSPAQLNV